MERRVHRYQYSEANKELWDLVRPDDDKDWEFNFTDMSDFDRVFQRITSVPDWKQDIERVYLFVIMRQRKHTYFNQSYFEEDLVIVPNLWHINEPRPNTEGLSEQQRKLSLLVHDFLGSDSKYLRAGYDQVFEQFDAIENWERNPVLAKLHEKVKALEAWHRKSIEPRASQIQQSQNDAMKIEAEKWVEKKKKAYEWYLPGKLPVTEAYIKLLISEIHRSCKNWRHNETLQKWNRLLGAQLRVFQLKKQGIWQTRIVHKQSLSERKGLLQRIWAGIWAEKEEETKKQQ